jgi:hypothetical protein
MEASKPDASWQYLLRPWRIADRAYLLSFSLLPIQFEIKTKLSFLPTWKDHSRKYIRTSPYLNFLAYGEAILDSQLTATCATEAGEWIWHD